MISKKIEPSESGLNISNQYFQITLSPQGMRLLRLTMEQLAPDKDGTTRSFEDDGTMPNNSATQAGDEQLQNENISASRFGIPSS